MVGALLLGLLAAPVGAARRLTSRLYRGPALAVGLAVGEMRAGLALSYAVPALPPSFAVVSTAIAVYAMAVVIRRPPRRVGQARRSRMMRHEYLKAHN
ncbi:hypothetical protein [Streptomyces sp. A012304]|uniref:hypothetical protein n=1 Tax=Streptomyces sp. A012304 TaxID=375446 RepID=UPI002232401F|nr:hypothetical protein [Streptomyces sp. A012304]GKQ35991.1 hypothetical protein ALMP_25340 [Streptomyces sp. A012304]